MEDSQKQNEAYIRTVREQFQLMQNYNSTIVSVGYASFFAMAAFVRDKSDNRIFLYSVIAMSLSIS